MPKNQPHVPTRSGGHHSLTGDKGEIISNISNYTYYTYHNHNNDSFIERFRVSRVSYIYHTHNIISLWVSYIYHISIILIILLASGCQGSHISNYIYYTVHLTYYNILYHVTTGSVYSMLRYVYICSMHYALIMSVF